MRSKMNIPLAKPYIGEEEIEAVARVLRSGWLVQGTQAAEFEKMVSNVVGVRHAITTSSCTTALHMALLSLGIGPGDKVILPAFSFVATANAIEYTGATPLFVDIDLPTYNIDWRQVERCLERNYYVKVIMPVHLFGLAADMGYITMLASEYSSFIVEDAACSLGAIYSGIPVGSMGIGCFSFHPRKSITTGEGGMVTTSNSVIANRINRLKDHGSGATSLTRHENWDPLMVGYDILGYNYRMTDIQAAIGIEQMKKLDYIIEQRTRRARIYDERLKEVEHLNTPVVPIGCKHVYQAYVIQLDPVCRGVELSSPYPEARNRVMAELGDRGIATRQGTQAIHTLGYYQRKYGLKPEDYPNALAADRLSIALPLYVQMTDEEQEYVIENLVEVVGKEIGG